MLCCVGLFAGVVAGAYLGLPWAPYVTIPLGAAGGLLADIKIFHAFEKKRKPNEQQKAAEPSMNEMCCASIFNLRKKNRR